MSTIVSQSASWDNKINNFVTTTTVESLTDWPTISATAVDAQKVYEGGVYRITYKDSGDTTSGSTYTPPTTTYSYEIHTTTSTEPLLTHPIFASGGTYELSSADKVKIQEAVANPALWATYAGGGGGASAHLSFYSTYIVEGTDSYLNPAITLSITDDESSLPSMSSIGKIATVTNAPTLPSGGNWILTGMNAVALPSGKWRISKEYRSSGRYGWNSTLYS